MKRHSNRRYEMGPTGYRNMPRPISRTTKARRQGLEPLEVWPGEPLALAAEERMGVRPDAMFNALPYLGGHKALGWGRVRVFSEEQGITGDSPRVSPYNNGFGAYHVGKTLYGAEMSPMEFALKIEAGRAYGIVAGDKESYYVAVFKRINRKAKGKRLLDID